MPRREINSDDTKIDQKAPIIGDIADREPEIVKVESELDIEYADALAFNEEPVTIRLEPSPEKNAAKSFPAWVNGVPAEVLIKDRWYQMGWLPVGLMITVKRKVLAVIASAKIDTIQTDVLDAESERPNNVINRNTSAVHSFSVIEDKNPIGAQWLTELRMRNM